MAIKTGTSIQGTGTITSNTDSTVTFSQVVTTVRINNNTGNIMYCKFNGAMTASPPQDYDLIVPANSDWESLDDSLDVSTIHVYTATGQTLPHNDYTFLGW